MKFKLGEIAKLCGGTLYGDENVEITAFFTDSRQAEKGKMFVPIKGENVDAHKFILSVFNDGGCTFSEIAIENMSGNWVLVPDNIKALQTVALNYRQRFTIPFVGITGSVGKTTTKEMIALALESEKNTLKTAGNANSQVGLPITLLRVSNENQAAVIEMGMSMPGEMRKITWAARPNLAVITNIGVSHIEFHGTREKILEEKLHITDYFTNDNTLFVNSDDDLLAKIQAKYNIVKFGVNENADYRAVNIAENYNGSSFICCRNGERIPMHVPVPGLHNVRNALVALAVSEYIGVKTENAVKAVAAYTAPEMRQQIKKIAECTVIDDTYNASPDSMLGAVDILTKLNGSKKIAVLASMLELGGYSEKGHRDVGEYVKKAGVDFLITIGEEAKYISDSFANKEKTRNFANNEDAFIFLKNIMEKNDVILIKGSRGMKTEYIVKELAKVELG